jgi:hypothetical protein
MSKACLDAARSLASQCVFALEESLDACLSVVRVTKKGVPLPECQNDGACAIERGAGYQCVDSQCLPEVEVALGAGCLLETNALSVPICGSMAACDVTSGKCVPRIATGGACMGAWCFDGDHCAMGKCTPRLSEGQPCDGPEACLEGLECQCTIPGCTTPICLSEPGLGGACQYPAECTAGTSCVDAICKPEALSICVLPAPP